MKLEDIFLAKFAELTPDGLFTVVGGGVNRINASGFPWSWGFFVLVTRLRLTPEEAQAKHITAVERETPNGQIQPIVGEAPLMHLPPATETGPDGRVVLNSTTWLLGQHFAEPGVYKYRFKIDGQGIGAVELLVTGPEHDACLAQAVAEFPLSNSELLASVERCRPPQSWYDEDHGGLY